MNSCALRDEGDLLLVIRNDHLVAVARRGMIEERMYLVFLIGMGGGGASRASNMRWVAIDALG